MASQESGEEQESDQFSPEHQVMKLLSGKMGLFFQGRQILEVEGNLQLNDDDIFSISYMPRSPSMVVITHNGKGCIYLDDKPASSWYDQIIKIEDFEDAEGRVYVVFHVLSEGRRIFLIDGQEYGPFEEVEQLEMVTDLPAFRVQRDGRWYMFVNGRTYGTGYDDVSHAQYLQDGQDIVFSIIVDEKAMLIRNDTVDSDSHDNIYFIGVYQGKNVYEVRDGEEWRILWGDAPVSEPFDDFSSTKLKDGVVTVHASRNGEQSEFTITLH